MAVALAAGGCSTVLGLEDHEPFPPDAPLTVDAGQDVEEDVSVEADAAPEADATADAPMDVVSEDSAPPERVSKDLVALYTFDEGSGTTIKDVSGVSPALDLHVETGFLTAWHPGYLEIKGSTLTATTGAATKIYDACTSSNEMTLEAWVEPATTGQVGPARIVTMSVDTSSRDFTLAQDNDQYFMRLRTTSTTGNGEPPTLTLPGTLTTTLTHVVFTRESNGDTTIYLNGQIQGSSHIPGDFSNWSSSYHFGIANEMTKDRVWLGSLHLVAVYSRALTKDEALQNFAAGAD